MDDSERAFLLQQMQQSKRGFLARIAGLSQAQWRFKPAPTVWSVEECAEHVILAEDFIFDRARVALAAAEVPRSASSTLEHDRQLTAALLDRSSKATAPAPIVPTGRIDTPADAVRIFTEKRDGHIAYVKKTNDALRNHSASVPGIGDLDAYQIIVVTAAHSARHTEQIREVEQTAGYPAQ